MNSLMQLEETVAFTHDLIRMDCPFPIQSVTDIWMKRSLNEHGKLVVKGILTDESANKLIEKPCTDVPFYLYGQGAEEETPLFAGRITEIGIRHEGGMYTIQVEALSATNILEDELKTRSFQDGSMMYSDVVQQVLDDWDGRSISTVNDRVIGNMLLQYQESDWTFLKRIASHFNTVLVTDVADSSKPRLWFGLPEIREDLRDIRSAMMFTDRERFLALQASGMNVFEGHFVKWRVESLDVLGLGVQVVFRDRVRVVESVTMRLINGLLCFEYVLGYEMGTLVPKVCNENLQGVSLLGDVLETRDQEVRVHLRCDASQDTSVAQWMPFTAQTNNLMYCMPEIGSCLSVYYGNSDDSRPTATNAVNTRSGQHASQTDPDVRHLTVPAGHRASVCTPEVCFELADTTSLIVDDETVNFSTPMNLNIYSQMSVIFRAQEGVYIIAEFDIVMANSTTESQIFMDSMIGDTHISSLNDINQVGELRTPQPTLNRELEIEEYIPPDPPGLFGRIVRTVAVVAIAVVVTAVVIKTGGAALALVAKKAKSAKVAKAVKATKGKGKGSKGRKKRAIREARQSVDAKVNKIRAKRDKIQKATFQIAHDAADRGLEAWENDGNFLDILRATVDGALTGAVRSVGGFSNGGLRFLLKPVSNVAGGWLESRQRGEEHSWTSAGWDASFGLISAWVNLGGRQPFGSDPNLPPPPAMRELFGIAGADLIENIVKDEVKGGAEYLGIPTK